MSRRSTTLIKTALAAVHYSGAGSLLAPYTRGAGVIFMLHHVDPSPPQEFEPSRILKVTPSFLDSVVREVIDAGFDIIPLDAVRERLEYADEARPFACFTLDDGYRDNREYAYPVFRRYGTPFTVYVTTDLADGRGDFWWLTFEKVLRAAPQITLAMRGETRHFRLATAAEKEAAHHEIYWWLRALPETQARAVVAELAATHNIDPKAAHANLVMSWDELRDLADDPLVTIGAHTKRHFALAKLSEAEARAEMAESIIRIEAELGRPCRHFSYPYGCAKSAGGREFRLAEELGIETAVTTQKGLLYPEHAHELTALPRLSLNGDFQDLRYVKALLSGVPFALMNTLKRYAGARLSA
ncbi:polysaccharide deacetylase family protein [Hyphomicrobium sp.]|uniref:polysaccharide deacetylase family protein n=1 Tax=Hyphomicrobium sp. TaxID=82 RepID=UPI0025C28652|nr:polysaccharide deacetylase family protein [Hyphomicrobium sp.]